MNRQGWLILSWLLVCSTFGCVQRNFVPLQEELLAKENELRSLRLQRDEIQAQLQACQQENHSLRQQLEDSGRPPLLPEQAATLYTLEKITFQFTNGIDHDHLPGDDALQVHVQPRDHQGDLVKSPGSVTLELFDMALEEPYRRIGFWQFDAPQTQAAWSSGFLTSGYRFELSWQGDAPQHEELSLHVRFRTPDGRVFPKTEQVRVTLRTELPLEDGSRSHPSEAPQDETPPQTSQTGDAQPSLNDGWKSVSRSTAAAPPPFPWLR